MRCTERCSTYIYSLSLSKILSKVRLNKSLVQDEHFFQALPAHVMLGLRLVFYAVRRGGVLNKKLSNQILQKASQIHLNQQKFHKMFSTPPTTTFRWESLERRAYPAILLCGA